jgi:hypothetical protein
VKIGIIPHNMTMPHGVVFKGASRYKRDPRPISLLAR